MNMICRLYNHDRWGVSVAFQWCRFDAGRSIFHSGCDPSTWQRAIRCVHTRWESIVDRRSLNEGHVSNYVGTQLPKAAGDDTTRTSRFYFSKVRTAEWSRHAGSVRIRRIRKALLFVYAFFCPLYPSLKSPLVKYSIKRTMKRALIKVAPLLSSSSSLGA